MPTNHAKYSPSKAHRWFSCSGSVAYEALAPDSLPSKDSELGIFSHAVGEYCLQKRKHPKLLIGKTKKYKIDIGGIVETRKQKVTQEIAYAVGRYYDYVTKKAGKSKLHIERMVTLTKDLFGTPDVFFRKGNVLYVPDYKNGYNEVEIEGNLQLIIYGLGAYEWLKLHNKAGKIKQVCLGIIQPRSEGKTIKEWTISLNTLKAYKPKLLKAVKRAKKNPLDLCVGPWCKWCKGSPLCPELYIRAKQIDRFPEMETTSLVQLKKILDEKDAIVDYLNQVEAFFIRTIQHGKKIKGKKLVQKRATTFWRYDDEKILKLVRKKGFTESQIREMQNHKLRTPNQLKPIIGEKLFDKWSVKKSSGVKLVDESHSSPEVNSLIEDFKDE